MGFDFNPDNKKMAELLAFASSIQTDRTELLFKWGLDPLENQVARTIIVIPDSTGTGLNAHTSVKGQVIALGRSIGCVGHDVVVVVASNENGKGKG